MITRRRYLAGLLATSTMTTLAACATFSPSASSGRVTSENRTPDLAPPSPSSAPTSAPRSAATLPGATRTVAASPVAHVTGTIARYGVSGPFSGNYLEYGRIWRNAFSLALDEINGAGGVGGRLVELELEDTQSDPTQSVSVAQKLVADRTILAELGDFSSPASMAASSIYERAKLVQFGFTSSHPDFTTAGDDMFSIALTQQQDVSYLARLGFDNLGKKQAVLYQNTDWGKVTSSFYVDALNRLGGQVVATASYLRTDTDFTTILAKVRDASVDVLALISSYDDGAAILQQARATGITAKVIATGACYTPQFLTQGGAATNGVVMTTLFFPGNPRPEVQAFVRAYTQRYNETPDQFAALAYDAVKIVTWATEKGGFDRPAIQRAMATGTEIPSVIYGTFQFGPDRRVENANTVPIQVKDGAFVPFAVS